jgi:TonB-dependent receptor
MWKTSEIMGTLVVTGKAGGQTGAYNKEKNSDNLKNVVNTEMIQKLPDQTTADALQRVPGVSLQRDQGEGRYVQIRGTESRLSTVTINGQSIASPDAQTRSVALNVIPADQLAEIEVNKVLTPDMDGDAIGGTVNLITSSAKDTSLKAKINLTPGYTQLSNTPLWQGSGSIGKCFLPGGKLGVFFGGSYYKDQRETQGIELVWDTSIYIPTGQRGAYLYNMQYRDYNKTNERIGLNGRLDYHVSPKSKFFLIGSYNRYNKQEYRRTLGMNIEDQDARPMPDADVVGDVPTTRSIKDHLTEQSIAAATLGGSVKLGEIAVDGNGSYSYANTSEPDEMTVSFQRNSQSYRFIHTDADRPTFEPIKMGTYKSNLLTSGKEVFVYDSSFDTASYLGLGSAKIENTYSTENSFAGQLNVKIPFELSFGKLDVKTGVKALDHYKDQNISVTTYKDTGKYVFPNLSTFLGNYSNDDFYNNLYPMNDMPDPRIVFDSLTKKHTVIKGSGFVADSNDHLSIDPETFSANDLNGAGYLMGTLKTDIFTVKGGVRFEYSALHYSGFSDSVNSANSWVLTAPTSMYKNFFFALPMILGKYSPNGEINVRASYTRSFSRPDWYDLAPHVVYNVDDNVHTATKGNPDLRPTTSDNIDLSGEYFFNDRASVLFAGPFFKHMHDYIFSSEQDIYFNQSKTEWTYFSKYNGNDAYLGGIELEFQTKFFFLPSFLNGFGVNGNYIYTRSSARIPGLTVTTALPGQSEHVGNAALFFEKYDFSARAALNFQSNCIVQIAGTQNNYTPVYLDDHLQLDCSVSQKLSKNFSVLCEFQNLTNAPKKLYLGDVKHTTQMEYYGWTGQFGLRWSL